MNYAKIINGLAACMGIEARTFTRYNKPVTQGEGNEANMKARDCKMVVVDYKNTDISFHLRAGQIHFAEANVSSAKMLEKIKEADDSVVMFSTLEECAKESLGEKYLPALQDILSIAKGYVEDRTCADNIAFGSVITGEGDPAVVMVIECEGMVVVLTIKE